MKALTLHQPWASLVALGVKSIETRSWAAPPPLIGERVAIHAAMKAPTEHQEVGAWTCTASAAAWWMRDGPERWPEREVEDYTRLPLGAIVATARLHRCVPITWLGYHQRQAPAVTYDLGGADPLVLRYWPGDGAEGDVSDQAPYGIFCYERWAWMLDEIEPLDEPIPARGRQRLWDSTS